MAAPCSSCGAPRAREGTRRSGQCQRCNKRDYARRRKQARARLRRCITCKTKLPPQRRGRRCLLCGRQHAADQHVRDVARYAAAVALGAA